MTDQGNRKNLEQALQAATSKDCSFLARLIACTSIVSWFEHIPCVLVLLSLLLLFLSVLLFLLLLALVVLHMIYALLLAHEQPGDLMDLFQLFLPICLLFSHIHALRQRRRLESHALLLHRFR